MLHLSVPGFQFSCSSLRSVTNSLAAALLASLWEMMVRSKFGDWRNSFITIPLLFKTRRLPFHFGTPDGREFSSSHLSPISALRLSYKSAAKCARRRPDDNRQ